MTKIRLFNDNERITNEALNALQVAALANAVDAMGAAPPDGGILFGCQVETDLGAPSVSVGEGSVLIATGVLDEPNLYEVAECPGHTFTLPTPPTAGNARIDVAYLELSGTHVEDSSTAVYVRDPVTGVVTPTPLNIRQTRVTDAGVEVGTPATTTSFAPVGGGAHTAVLQAPSLAVTQVPVAYLFWRGSTLEAVLDARTLIGAGGRGSPRIRLVREGGTGTPYEDGMAVSDTVWKSEPSRWIVYGTDNGTSATSTVRLGSTDTNGIPTRVFRIIDGYGASRVLPPGEQISLAVSGSGSTSYLALSHVTGAPYQWTFGTSSVVTSDQYLVLSEMYFNGSGNVSNQLWLRKNLSQMASPPMDEDVLRIYPQVEVVDYNVTAVHVRVRAMLADGSDAPLGLRQQGIWWRVRFRYGNDYDEITTDGYVEVRFTTGLGTSHNTTLPGSLLGSTNGGLGYVVQDTSDSDANYCQFYFRNSDPSLARRVLLEIEAVLPLQAHTSDSTYYDADNTPASYGLFRYVPGGKGVAMIYVAT